MLVDVKLADFKQIADMYNNQEQVKNKNNDDAIDIEDEDY